MAGILDVFDGVTVMEPFASLLDSAEIINMSVDMDKNSVDIQLKCAELIHKSDLYDFIQQTKQIYSLKNFEVQIKYENISFSEEYYRELLCSLMYESSTCKAFMISSTGTLDNNILTIHGVKCGRALLESNKCADILKRIIDFELGLNVSVNIEYEDIDKNAYIESRDRLEKEVVKTAAAAKPQKHEEKTENKVKVSTGIIYGKEISGEPMEMRDVNDSTGICIVKGRVLTCESREMMKNGKLTGNAKLTFDIGDDNWGLSCSAFSKTEKLKKAMSAVVEGSYLKVRGNYEMDTFAHCYLLNVLSIELCEKPEGRKDNCEEKRVELHLHTKMSAKDAVSSATDLINCAASWGHKAIAITDHGVAQAFPEAHKAASSIRKKGQEFKVLYGIEGYFINDMPLSAGRVEKDFKDETFIVFDIETTGLSAEEDRITEIGAVKIEHGEVTETFGQLINPEREIPYNITEITGITNEMVENEPTIAEVLPKFLEFCDGHTVVAHNAKFDVGFIRINAKRQKLTFGNRAMDTLLLSRELFPNERTHRLDAVVKRLGVVLENHHRAVDDATATAWCFIKMMAMKQEKQKELSEDFSIETNPELLKQQYNHIVILAKNLVGLKNMYKLISASNLKYYYKRPRIPKSVLAKHREGLIIGSACEAGELFRAIVDDHPQEEIEQIASFYDYLEIQPIGNNEFMVRSGNVTDDDALRELNKKVVELGDKIGKPVVATCDVHFMNPEDEVYRRVLQGAQGYSDADLQAPLYLRTTDEMLEEFSYLGKEKAYEIVVKNTNMIADMIENIQPVKDGSYPPSIENCEKDLLDMCHAKAHKVYGEVLPKIVEERMNRELDCITKYGYSVMYIIAQKLVKKSNEAGYLVGSRGSVGSSFAAYLSDITEVNALCPHYICDECKYYDFFDKGEYNIGIDMPDKICPKCGAKLRKDGFNIPFETFLGFKGDKVPDIDLNFSGEYQATAHKYVEELFGEGYVFKAGTIGTIAENTARGFARKYYEKKGIIPTNAELVRVSKGMEGVKNTTGQHPGGVIVCPKTMDIHDFCPIQHPAEKKDSDIVTTHFDFHSIHDNLLKLDILGHDDPSTIRMLENLTGIDATKIPLDDPDTMSLFHSTEALGITPDQIDSEVGTFGVPEFGTSFTRGMLLDTKPTTFYELVIIAGLSHGTDVWLNNAQDLVKAGTATLSKVIGLRDDIMTYLIQRGLDPSMSFKIMEFVRKGRAAKEGMPEEFENAMREHNVPEWYINSCKKIKYMFPKAHAAAYVMMGFRVAYFKVHYPIEFYIAYYTVRADLFDAALMAKGDEKLKEEMRKIKQIPQFEITATEKSLYTIMEIVHEMYQRGIEFMPVDLYKSHAFKFQKVDGKILLPINAFQGIGDAAAMNIMNAAKEGEFLSQEQLKQRTGINKTVMETLEQNGCLDGLQETSQMQLF